MYVYNVSVRNRDSAAAPIRYRDGAFLPAPIARRMTTVSSTRSMNGYAIPTSFCRTVEAESCATGDIRKTHGIVPTPIATIIESMRLSRSRPGLRRRISSTRPPTQARVDEQVRDVADRGVREIGAEEVVVVVGDDVPDDEERLTEREQVPGGPRVRLPHPDRDDDRDRRGQRDQVEEPSLAQVRQEQETEQRRDAAAQIQEPGPGLHHCHQISVGRTGDLRAGSEVP